MRTTWEQYGIAIALAAAARSEDPWLRVGACVLRQDHTVAATGYNGAPSGLEIDWADRNQRRRYVIHAEANALRYCTPTETRGGLLAVSHHPCAECVKLAAAYGITSVVFGSDLDPDTYDQQQIAAVAAVLGVTVTRVEPTAKEET